MSSDEGQTSTDEYGSDTPGSSDELMVNDDGYEPLSKTVSPFELEPFQLPSISYAKIARDNPERWNEEDRLVEALMAYGACRIRDHGISQEKLDRCFEMSRAYHNHLVEDNESGKGKLMPTKIQGPLDSKLEQEHGALNPALYTDRLLCVQELQRALGSLYTDCGLMAWNILDSLSGAMELPVHLPSLNNGSACFEPSFYTPGTTNPDVCFGPCIDPSLITLRFQDPHAGIKIADLRDLSADGNLSVKRVVGSATFYPVAAEPGECLLFAGHIFRKLVPAIKHAVYCIERSENGVHLNFWHVPGEDVKLRPVGARRGEGEVKDEGEDEGGDEGDDEGDDEGEEGDNEEDEGDEVEDVRAYLKRVSPNDLKDGRGA
ncbi:uncharacterized protein DSM5745_04391 [Aspergillus mulundensis]|uniref:Non-haem dioxygenase N-terminal domain-containing protein n=1 Tax=Aspergillus mulundensis TaxID=1810919 RepID=A0A3D8SCK7_9EURO|nr:hypothetical protein DSM5745_04391 [Aspergillus mulundensis]RDW84065.1 hypothetical protein DSM5745_04391 [Aspergillus mulundensis]